MRLFLAGMAALLLASPALAQPKAGERTMTPEQLLDQLGVGVSDAELARAVAAASAFPLGTAANPIRVGGPEGERAYIARLRCADGSPPRVGQRGSAGVGAFGTIVDVGGNNGAFLAGILEAFPSVRGIVFDQPHVVAGAREVLADRGVADRCEAVGGDFLQTTPAGGDAYLLKRVMYSFDDDDSLAILRAIRAGMHADSRLLLLEPLLEPGNEFDWGKLYDVLLLVMAGGGGRSLEALQELFAKADLELVRVIRTRTLPIVEARPV